MICKTDRWKQNCSSRSLPLHVLGFGLFARCRVWALLALVKDFIVGPIQTAPTAPEMKQKHNTVVGLCNKIASLCWGERLLGFCHLSIHMSSSWYLAGGYILIPPNSSMKMCYKSFNYSQLFIIRSCICAITEEGSPLWAVQLKKWQTILSRWASMLVRPRVRPR